MAIEIVDLKMVIFHSYVSLPEGNGNVTTMDIILGLYGDVTVSHEKILGCYI